MKGGDLTEIGEKGVNLSGGQKARISIARAWYANSDIILMDDPVSALDASVKAKIFEDVILKEFEGKTRILVTHSIEFINQADKIIILENGGIASVGKFEELKEIFTK